MSLPPLSLKRLSDVLDFFSMGMLALSRERQIVAMNRSAEMVTGCSAADAIGHRCGEVLSSELCVDVCRFDEVMATEAASFGEGLEFSDPVTGAHNITRLMVPLYSDQGEVSGCIEIFQDYSALTDLMERVRHDDRRLKVILDNLDIGVLTVDRGGHVTFFNTMAETITGFGRNQILGKSCAAVLGSTFAQDLLASHADDGESPKRNAQEGEIITRSGRAIPIKANYLPLKNEEGRNVGGLATLADLSLLYQLDSAINERYTFYDMVGKDPAMRQIFEIVPVIAASNATVLIGGPTGTGKDILASVIHSASPRRERPMVKVNCAALPDNLLESEMFGYTKGAFTGADRDKPGRFQEADGGTIFLDEIGDMPLSLQAKLLRVLESKDFYPLGSRRPTRVDVRVISATNQDLEQLVLEKRFRQDLFYRLNVMRLDLPPLVARRSDIPILISHVLKRLGATKKAPTPRIAEDTLEILLNHDYPGNVRELENIIEHALIICQGDIIERQHLPLTLVRQTAAPTKPSPDTPVDEPLPTGEKARIAALLEKFNGNRNQTARALQLNRTTLWRKMKRYGLLG